jgi:hypothetical protein
VQQKRKNNAIMADMPTEETDTLDTQEWGTRRAAEHVAGMRVYKNLEPAEINMVLMWEGLHIIAAVLAMHPPGKEQTQIATLTDTLPELINWFRKSEEEDDSK